MFEFITVLILLYQVTIMPSLDNAKYTFGTVGDRVVRMNTRDGSLDECDEEYKCHPAKK
ncbi:hypothetical protein UFOVP71_189 [uncultured Caudovirales phage]|uniref:Uncharacterized protein n=1 Tax=uncultured Caudovirales phage TaxID=2100421 RepID=A0A6J5TAK5_9CAUD|nr:hypothetical protein UFOVP71_189 [uncultured Caudovirales phage]